MAQGGNGLLPEADKLVTNESLRAELSRFSEKMLHKKFERFSEHVLHKSFEAFGEKMLHEIREAIHNDKAPGLRSSRCYGDIQSQLSVTAANNRRKNRRTLASPFREQSEKWLASLKASSDLDELYNDIPLVHDWMRRSPQRNTMNDEAPGRWAHSLPIGLEEVPEACAERELEAATPLMSRHCEEDSEDEDAADDLESPVPSERARMDCLSVRQYCPLDGCSGERSAEMKAVPTSRSTAAADWRRSLQRLVWHPVFEGTTCLLIVVNSIFIGLETQASSDSASLEACMYRKMSSFFCLVFSLEMSTRLLAYGKDYFKSKTWLWNVFDLVVTCNQVLEQILSHTAAASDPDSSLRQLFSVLRLVRILRLLRVLRLVDEFQKIIAAIAGSVESLLWLMMFLMVVIYLCGVLFTQLTMNYVQGLGAIGDERVELEEWFGSVPRSVLTLFESVFGGLSWDQQVTLIMDGVGAPAAILYCIYVAFCLVAVMNVITGVFVDKALKLAEADSEARLVQRVSNLFFDPQHPHRQISWADFEEKLSTSTMLDYFKAININPREARGLFDLLDSDCSGGVDCDEIVNGLLRLRGTAGALETSLLLREVSHMCKRLDVSFQQQSKMQAHFSV
eukprot:TRINITY_DN39395_c0_g1_i6.p1 TRINITY_DN39395_c0_g1~~TRINITY_DN39395_c0_g1_i6.p1  ORF type:complete len:647 (+),score=160.21 TRINITY_DN39395_c0_g1_i6:76-1941(+)